MDDDAGVRPDLSGKRVSFTVTILTDAESWMRAHLNELLGDLINLGHRVRIVASPSEVGEGDFLICLSATRLVPSAILSRNRHNLVVHQSNLPAGRGWSPMSWQILEGKNVIPVCLFEAEADVDSGVVYCRDEIRLNGTELIDELRSAQAASAFQLIRLFFSEYPEIVHHACPQVGEASYYKRRYPSDSRLDPDKTIREQFNLFRIVDNNRYPAFFELGGETYSLKIEKADGVQRPSD